MAVDFDRHNALFLRHFGETVIFWPSQEAQTEASAIVYRSARPESTTPGKVTGLFYVLSDLPAAPAKDDIVEIGGVQYILATPADGGDGSATAVVRKSS